MYLKSFVAAKNGAFKYMLIIEILLKMILCWCSYNPLGMLFGRSIKNLELNQVKFKIRGGLLGILLRENSAEESADGFC